MTLTIEINHDAGRATATRETRTLELQTSADGPGVNVSVFPTTKSITTEAATTWLPTEVD